MKNREMTKGPQVGPAGLEDEPQYPHRVMDDKEVCKDG